MFGPSSPAPGSPAAGASPSAAAVQAQMQAQSKKMLLHMQFLKTQYTDEAKKTAEQQKTIENLGQQILRLEDAARVHGSQLEQASREASSLRAQLRALPVAESQLNWMSKCLEESQAATAAARAQAVLAQSAASASARQPNGDNGAADLAEQLRVKSDELSTAQQLLREQKTATQAQQQGADDVKAQLQQAKDQLQKAEVDAKARLEQAEAKANARVAELEEQLKQTEIKAQEKTREALSHLTFLKDQVDTLRKSSAQHQEEVEALKAQVASHRKSAAQRQEEVEALKAQVASHRKSAAQRQEEVKALKAQVDSHRKSAAQSQEEVEALKAQVASHRKSAAQSQEEVEALKAQVASHRKSAAQRQEEVKALKAQVDSHRKSAAESKEEVKALKKAAVQKPAPAPVPAPSPAPAPAPAAHTADASTSQPSARASTASASSQAPAPATPAGPAPSSSSPGASAPASSTQKPWTTEDVTIQYISDADLENIEDDDLDWPEMTMEELQAELEEEARKNPQPPPPPPPSEEELKKIWKELDEKLGPLGPTKIAEYRKYMEDNPDATEIPAELAKPRPGCDTPMPPGAVHNPAHGEIPPDIDFDAEIRKIQPFIWPLPSATQNQEAGRSTEASEPEKAARAPEASSEEVPPVQVQREATTSASGEAPASQPPVTVRKTETASKPTPATSESPQRGRAKLPTGWLISALLVVPVAMLWSFLGWNFLSQNGALLGYSGVCVAAACMLGLRAASNMQVAETSSDSKSARGGRGAQQRSDDLAGCEASLRGLGEAPAPDGEAAKVGSKAHLVEQAKKALGHLQSMKAQLEKQQAAATAEQTRLNTELSAARKQLASMKLTRDLRVVIRDVMLASVFIYCVMVPIWASAMGTDADVQVGSNVSSAAPGLEAVAPQTVEL